MGRAWQGSVRRFWLGVRSENVKCDLDGGEGEVLNFKFSSCLYPCHCLFQSTENMVQTGPISLSHPCDDDQLCVGEK